MSDDVTASSHGLSPAAASRSRDAAWFAAEIEARIKDREQARAEIHEAMPDEESDTAAEAWAVIFSMDSEIAYLRGILIRSRLQPAAAAEAPISAEAVIPTPQSLPPSEVEWLVARQRTRLAELAEFAEIPKALFKEVVDLQLELAHALHSLSLRAQMLEEALKPFATYGRSGWRAITKLDFERARTALHGSEGGE